MFKIFCLAYPSILSFAFFQQFFKTKYQQFSIKLLYRDIFFVRKKDFSKLTMITVCLIFHYLFYFIFFDKKYSFLWLNGKSCLFIQLLQLAIYSQLACQLYFIIHIFYFNYLFQQCYTVKKLIPCVLHSFMLIYFCVKLYYGQ